jgi:hypothetical protein
MAPHTSIWPASKIRDGICQTSLDYTNDQNFVTRTAWNLANRIHFMGYICINGVKKFGKRDPVRLILIRLSSGTDWNSSAICWKEHRSTDLSLSLSHTHTHTHTHTQTDVAQLIKAMELNRRLQHSLIWHSVVWYIKYCTNAWKGSVAGQKSESIGQNVDLGKG